MRLHVKENVLIWTRPRPGERTVRRNARGPGRRRPGNVIAVLSDVLRVIEEPQVVIEMGDGLLPAVVYGEGDEAYRYVVMPVRVG